MHLRNIPAISFHIITLLFYIFYIPNKADGFKDELSSVSSNVQLSLFTYTSVSLSDNHLLLSLRTDSPFKPIYSACQAMCPVYRHRLQLASDFPSRIYYIRSEPSVDSVHQPSGQC